MQHLCRCNLSNHSLGGSALSLVRNTTRTGLLCRACPHWDLLDTSMTAAVTSGSQHHMAQSILPSTTPREPPDRFRRPRTHNKRGIFGTLPRAQAQERKCWRRDWCAPIHSSLLLLRQMSKAAKTRSHTAQKRPASEQRRRSNTPLMPVVRRPSLLSPEQIQPKQTPLNTSGDAHHTGTPPEAQPETPATVILLSNTKCMDHISSCRSRRLRRRSS